MNLQEIEKQIRRLQELRAQILDPKYDRILYQVQWDWDQKTDGEYPVMLEIRGKLNPCPANKRHDLWKSENGTLGEDEAFDSLKSAIHNEMVTIQDRIVSENKKLTALERWLLDPHVWDDGEET